VKNRPVGASPRVSPTVQYDAYTFDPTLNVQALVEAAVGRIDDMMAAEARRVNEANNAERRRVDEQLALRDDYAKQLREAESKRIDAIRAVDVAAVAVASERAAQSAQVLANQVSASAETLRTLVASTAVTVAQQLAQVSSQLSDRISQLEKSSYEGIGKGRLADPMQLELLAEVKAMKATQHVTTGAAGGQKEVWGWLAAAVGVAVGIGGLVFALMKR